MQLAIAAHHLVKQYGPLRALDQVSLEVRQGEIFGFLGPNGAGKSTFVKILLNLLKPSSGQARLFGLPTQQPHSRKNVGFLPENIRAHDFLTVEEFIRFHARLAEIEAHSIARETGRCLDAVGLGAEGRRRIGTLSKGMLQRVGIAQAILGSPELLILDEPTSGLDPIGFTDLRNLLLDMNRRGTTIFLNSHLLSEVERTCDRIAILHRGKIIKVGSKADLSDRDRHLEIIAEGLSEGVLPQITAVSEKPAELDGTVLRAYPRSDHDCLAIHRIIVERGGRVSSLRWKAESLEELFYRLVKDENPEHNRGRH
jgi:ABC-2 type transport system ATP-binding protein